MKKIFKPTPYGQAKRLIGKSIKATWVDHAQVSGEKLSHIIGSKPIVFINEGVLVGIDDNYFIVQTSGNPDDYDDHNNDHYRLLRKVTMVEKNK